ncbi:hypothetical protein D3C71_1379480 [compost metagenome]
MIITLIDYNGAVWTDRSVVPRTRRDRITALANFSVLREIIELKLIHSVHTPCRIVRIVDLYSELKRISYFRNIGKGMLHNAVIFAAFPLDGYPLCYGFKVYSVCRSLNIDIGNTLN